MKLFDRITSYIAIICVLVLCFMLVSSAGSFVPDNNSTEKFVPYVPLESIEIHTFDSNSESVIYTLNLSDAFRSLTVNESYGASETEVLLPLGTTDSDATTQYVTVQLSTLYNSSGTLTVGYTINHNQLPGSGTSDGTSFVIKTSEFTYNSELNSNAYVPYFRFVGMQDSETSSVVRSVDSYNYYKPSSGSASMDVASYSSDSVITGNSNFYDCFGFYEAYNSFLGRNDSNSNIIGNSMMHVKSASFECTNNYGFTGFSIVVPYVPDDLADSFYTTWINSFDLGTNSTVVQTVIRTSIVTSYINSPSDGSYPDFSTFLVTAVRGFMDFGFFGISIAGILSAIILFKLVRVFINFFAGG